MARPQDIDPAVLAQIQGQLGMGAPGGPPPGTGEGSELSLPPAVAARYGLNPSPPAPRPAPGPLSPTEAMLSGGLQRAGVPTTQATPAGPAGAPGGNAVQGDFVEPGAAKGPAWRPNMGMSNSPAHATSNVSPGVRGEFDTAMGQEREAALGLGRANAEGQTQQAATLDEMVHNLGAERFAAQERQQRRSAALDTQMADYKRLQDEAASQKINPNQWWGDKSGAEKALGIIGIILGGFGGPGNNVALKIMNDQTNASIDAQKHNMATKQHHADAAMNIYSQKMRQFGDEGAADLATRAQMIEQFKLQMQSEAAATGSKVAMAQANQAAGQLSLEQAKIHQQLETWHQTGTAGGITKEDSARAAEFVKKGYPPEKALQLAMSLRGVAPSEGLPAVAGAGGKPSPEAAAAKQLGNTAVPEALGLGERIEAGASHLPLIGPAFQDTSGARKELAQDQANIPAYNAAHKGGARTPEQQEHTYGALMYKNTDSPQRRAQKARLRKMVEDNVVDSAFADQLANHLGEEGD